MSEQSVQRSSEPSFSDPAFCLVLCAVKPVLYVSQKALPQKTNVLTFVATTSSFMGLPALKDPCIPAGILLDPN